MELISGVLVVLMLVIIIYFAFAFKKNGEIPIIIKRTTIYFLLVSIILLSLLNFNSIYTSKRNLNTLESIHSNYIEMIRGSLNSLIISSEFLMDNWYELSTEEKIQLTGEMYTLASYDRFLKVENIGQDISVTNNESSVIYSLRNYEDLSHSAFNFTYGLYNTLKTGTYNSTFNSEEHIRKQLENFLYDLHFILNVFDEIEVKVGSEDFRGKDRINQWVINLSKELKNIKVKGRSPFLRELGKVLDFTEQ